MEAKPTKIYMTVDTKKINSENVHDCVEFKDDRGNSKPTKDSKNFVSLINAGQKVFWYGEPKEVKKDTIKILEIERKSKDEPEFLETKGRDEGQSGAYKASVINAYTEGLESYNITFKIKDKEGDFTVDPKLQMEKI